MIKVKKIFIMIAIFLNLTLISNSRGAPLLPDSTSVKNPSVTSYIYVSLQLNMIYTSLTTNPFCMPDRKSYSINFLNCPNNFAPKITMSQAYAPQVLNALCNKTSVNLYKDSTTTITLQGGIGSDGRGIGLFGLACSGIIGAWIPSSVLSKMGTAQPIQATVLGETVYVGYQQGTMPTLQCYSNRTSFNVLLNNWGAISDSSDCAPFLRKLFPNGFNNSSVVVDTSPIKPQCVGCR